MLLLLSSAHRHLLKGMDYFLAHLDGCWSFNSLLLTSVLFPGNENALPGSKKRKIAKSRYILPYYDVKQSNVTILYLSISLCHSLMPSS